MRARRWTLLIGAVCMLLQMVPAAATATETEPWFEQPLDRGPGFSSSSVGTVPLSDGHVGAGVKALIPAGAHHGASARWDLDDAALADPDEMYWRYWIRFPEGFSIEPPYRGKLPGPANTYGQNCYGGRVSTPWAPCWSARMMFTRDYRADDGTFQEGPDDQTLIGFYTYHLDGPGHRGDILPWDDDVAMLDHGRWYCVEGRMQLNTPGANDGTLEGWIDGESAFARSDFAWRRTDEAFLDIDSFWFNVYYGGAGSSPVQNEIHFDSFAFSAERVGCRDYEGSFADDDDSIFEPDIEWLVASGLTHGCNPPDNHRFCPGAAATRGEVAALLTRALDLPPADGDTFTDDDGSWFEPEIEALVAAGITAGCGPRLFCPHDVVTREQMAAFLRRGLGDELPLDDPAEFGDIAGSQFAADISWLSAAGITQGCRTGEYCGHDVITRGEVAAFLHRAVTLRPIEPPPPAPPSHGGSRTLFW